MGDGGTDKPEEAELEVKDGLSLGITRMEKFRNESNTGARLEMSGHVQTTDSGYTGKGCRTVIL